MPLSRQVERAQLTADISQRLQERRTIIDKLLREVTMQPSTMQDIAVPCRGRIRAADRCASLRSEAQGFPTKLQVGHPAPDGDGDD